jgi:ribosomal protein S1
VAFTPHNDVDVDSELEKFILGHEALNPGDKLEGKVIQVKPGGKVLIDFGKFRAVAESPFPIKEGEVIHVKVVAKRPKLKLRLETGAGNRKLLDVNV